MRSTFKLANFLGVFVLGSSLLHAEDLPEKGRAKFELAHEPKQCITTPCPQFRVVKMNGKPVSGIGADIDRKDFEKSAMANFKTFFAKGSFTHSKENPGYIEIQVEEWRATVKETFSDKPSQR